MSMHRVALTRLERDGLINHGLRCDSPSQLSDTFRLGVAWALAQSGVNWKPIDTAPKDNARLLILARIDDKGQILEIDWDAAWEFWQESWELPDICGYTWCSASGIEEPTHWTYQ